MKSTDVRLHFTKGLLPTVFFDNPNYFIDALNDGGEEAVITASKQLWSDFLTENGDHPNNHPIDFDVWLLALNEEDVTENEETSFLLLLQLPESKKGMNTVAYIGMLYGVKGELRYFVGETDYHNAKNPYVQTGGMNRLIFLIEMNVEDGAFTRNNLGSLYGDTHEEELTIFAQSIKNLFESVAS